MLLVKKAVPVAIILFIMMIILSIFASIGERQFYTKGDNNNTVDEEIITAGDIAGKELFHIPKLGFLSNYT
ncbi:hypothetical protein [Cytobacillus pseudoceanisediminis]|uniref:hypothetical protein n=1 Tax=Cytobacillus pseudoceanisediminis TaxID=3051614 RepID=UPI003C2B429C